MTGKSTAAAQCRSLQLIPACGSAFPSRALPRWPILCRRRALGWGPFDLFGCDRDRPFARIDQAGLLWLLNGAKLVILAEDAATIETRTGVRQSFRRKPSDPGRVLAWELAR